MKFLVIVDDYNSCIQPMISTYKLCFSDVPLVDRFKIENRNCSVHMTWLEHKIYVSCVRLKGLRVFDDHAPFKEIPGGIGITGLRDVSAMSASLSTRSIFISDTNGRCLWKIQIPQKEAKRFPLKYDPWMLSATRDDETVCYQG